jgi:hypothetical protein
MFRKKTFRNELQTLINSVAPTSANSMFALAAGSVQICKFDFFL